MEKHINEKSDISLKCMIPDEINWLILYLLQEEKMIVIRKKYKYENCENVSKT